MMQGVWGIWNLAEQGPIWSIFSTMADKGEHSSDLEVAAHCSQVVVVENTSPGPRNDPATMSLL